MAASAHAQQPAASPEEGEAAEERGPPEEEELQEARGGKKKAKTGVGLQRVALAPAALCGSCAGAVRGLILPHMLGLRPKTCDVRCWH